MAKMKSVGFGQIELLQHRLSVAHSERSTVADGNKRLAELVRRRVVTRWGRQPQPCENRLRQPCCQTTHAVRVERQQRTDGRQCPAAHQEDVEDTHAANQAERAAGKADDHRCAEIRLDYGKPHKHAYDHHRWHGPFPELLDAPSGPVEKDSGRDYDKYLAQLAWLEPHRSDQTQPAVRTLRLRSQQHCGHQANDNDIDADGQVGITPPVVVVEERRHQQKNHRHAQPYGLMRDEVVCAMVQRAARLLAGGRQQRKTEAQKYENRNTQNCKRPAHDQLTGRSPWRSAEASRPGRA